MSTRASATWVEDWDKIYLRNNTKYKYSKQSSNCSFKANPIMLYV